MGGCRCTYKNCQNTTKTTENVHFFHYPIKHKDRCAIWIKNANKPEYLMLEADQLRNKVVCEQHFEEKWFPNYQKKRLLQGAIPTLDGNSYEENMIAPRSEILPDTSELKDNIHIFPASDDGTIFILETEAMHDKSSTNVESYIYENGLLVPSHSSELKRAKLDVTSNSWLQESDFQFSTSITNSNATPKSQFFKSVSDTEISFRKLQEENLTQEINSIKKEDLPNYSEDPHKNSNPVFSNPFERDLIQEINPHFMQSSTAKSANKSSNTSSEKQFDYLLKIEQHSREIENIKRILKSNSFDSKPNKKSALKVLQKEIPPTLFTILNLCLKKSYEFSDEDVEFFTILHKISPEVYQLLKSKYQWSLPCIDIVESHSND